MAGSPPALHALRHAAAMWTTQKGPGDSVGICSMRGAIFAAARRLRQLRQSFGPSPSRLGGRRSGLTGLEQMGNMRAKPFFLDATDASHRGRRPVPRFAQGGLYGGASHSTSLYAQIGHYPTD